MHGRFLNSRAFGQTRTRVASELMKVDLIFIPVKREKTITKI
jgi:hypothetical protein